MPDELMLVSSMKTSRSYRTNNQKRQLFHCRALDAKEGSQEIPGITDKFSLGVQNRAEKRITDFCQENKHSKHPLPTT